VDTRTQVWREPNRIWHAPVFDQEQPAAKDRAREAIRVALEARDLIDAETKVRISLSVVEEQPDGRWFDYATTRSYEPRHPQGYRPVEPPLQPGGFFLGQHVRVTRNDVEPLHYLPIGDVVEVVGLNEYDDTCYIVRGGTVHVGTYAPCIPDDRQHVHLLCLEATDDPLTSRIAQDPDQRFGRNNEPI